MFLKNIDMISPPITFYYKGYLTHSSILGDILTFIIFSLITVICIFFSLDFFERKNPSVCHYNRYTEDAGEFPVDSSSLFSFIQILDTISNEVDKVDFDAIR